jgi:acyl carrier protein
MVTLEQQYGVKIDDADMTEVVTVRDLYHLLVKVTDATPPASDPARSA